MLPAITTLPPIGCSVPACFSTKPSTYHAVYPTKESSEGFPYPIAPPKLSFNVIFATFDCFGKYIIKTLSSNLLPSIITSDTSLEPSITFTPDTAPVKPFTGLCIPLPSLEDLAIPMYRYPNTSMRPVTSKRRSSPCAIWKLSLRSRNHLATASLSC
ncbi:hypothetical protein TbgDal_II4370 [Trypanosoma brucei gambiense DAL972]|uniref:Uncharacterized protein n=1 Tax=Trypanosoma brucei gambiense (strain MHOM/CI/86/DAL972) TaxID=679716 RepID=C9ZJU8_TRYB9|nr:hypothetical protein TbgDal_II4370 [Trypanosoma brucei gambiense DAL972]CBH09658.1 hypothetical protein TbgDal_II4370 [Trypanosoma brucei gambiense DAL972]|eukprot:XP_011771962.1 hypothetical protein TbgDal_II4370 [Trypanosoma brucei gambiense DAL972]